MSGSAVLACTAGSPAAGFWFEVLFIDETGAQRRQPLASCWDVPFERAGPSRSFPSFKGQRNFPGLWWSATTGQHVGFESWVERDVAMLLDFDPEVVAFAAQPLSRSSSPLSTVLGWWRCRRGRRFTGCSTGSARAGIPPARRAPDGRWPTVPTARSVS
jgi:hypothetical protein